MGDRTPTTGRNAGGARRKVAVGLNTAAALLLALALAVMLNYLSYRHYYRADWSRNQYYTLSEKTLGLLGALSNTVHIVIFFQPQQQVFEDVDNLLREYEYASSMIRVERVDPDRDLARTEELMRKYQVDRANVVVFDYEGRSKYVTADDIVEMDYAPMMLGGEPSRVQFKGEQAFSSAIQSISQGRKPAVCFLKGHGERDVADYNRQKGYSDLAREIRRDNVELKPLVLGEKQTFPPDCDALVIAGPEKRLSDPELAVLRSYLERKGRLVVLLDTATETGLEPLLAEWGVRLARDVVVDTTRTLTGRELFLTEYAPHPITAKLRDMTSVLYLPRSVEPAYGPEEAADPADRPHVVPLASCSESGWGETDFSQTPMRYDPEADLPGPVSVAVAVEKGPAPGIDMQIAPTRLVVIGDSDFVANGGLTGANADFFLSALNWLLDREELMAIAPKPVDQARLIMTYRELRALFWILAVVLPGFIAAYGGLVWLRRRA